MPILAIKIGDQSIKGNENAGVSAGGQSRIIGFNTERIKRVEYTMEKRFDKQDEKLDWIMQRLK